MTQQILVAGVGMIPFMKPGTSESYFEMGAKAVRLALADAGIDTSMCSKPTPVTFTATPPAGRGCFTRSV
jgi:hypothetical protein